MASRTLLTPALLCEQHAIAPTSPRPHGSALPDAALPTVALPVVALSGAGMPAGTSYAGIDAGFGKGSSPPRGRPV